MPKVCHFTTVHPWNDVRIFYRECKSLARAGFDVTLIAPKDHDELVDSVQIKAISRYSSRLKRFVYGQLALLNRLKEESFDLYHFHDPELLFVGLYLRVLGKKVVFDIHENIVEQIKEKEWLPLRNLVSKVFSWMNRALVSKMYLVLAETSYENTYSSEIFRSKTVLNMPDLNFFERFKIESRANSDNGIFYIGGVSPNRGVFQMIKALEILKSKSISFTFHCIGPIESYDDEPIRNAVKKAGLEKEIRLYGSMDLAAGYEISRNCKVGVSILKPVGNYIHSYSTKIFEYMAIGLPVITSNFKLYQNVVQAHDTGICVDPLDVNEIAEKIAIILQDELKAHEYGLNGINVARNLFNWESQADVLVSFYHEILTHN